MVSYILFSSKPNMIENMPEINVSIRTRETAQQVKALPSEVMSSICCAHRGDSQLSQVVLWLLHVVPKHAHAINRSLMVELGMVSSAQ